jgi:GNAT superfamily N-acetyltransferase
MKIVKAVPDDLAQILELVGNCIQDMNSSGNTQWNDEYPPMDIFGTDIEKGTLFKFEDDNVIVGIVVLSPEQDKEYEPVDWGDRKGKPIVVHRLAVHPDWQRKGIASKFMAFAEKFAKKNGYTSIRIDTFSQNPSMQKLIIKFKYVRRPGEIFFPENEEPYYCYEKII